MTEDTAQFATPPLSGHNRGARQKWEEAGAKARRGLGGGHKVPRERLFELLAVRHQGHAVEARLRGVEKTLERVSRVRAQTIDLLGQLPQHPTEQALSCSGGNRRA